MLTGGKKTTEEEQRTSAKLGIFQMKSHKKMAQDTRLVVCGYSQVHGVDFSKTYMPIVNDTHLQYCC